MLVESDKMCLFVGTKSHDFNRVYIVSRDQKYDVAASAHIENCTENSEFSHVIRATCTCVPYDQLLTHRYYMLGHDQYMAL
jgi:ABC-type branched-subunit amino acid transport system substrate-binding protein